MSVGWLDGPPADDDTVSIGPPEPANRQHGRPRRTFGLALVVAVGAVVASFLLGRWSAQPAVSPSPARLLTARIALSEFSSIVSTSQRTLSCTSNAPFDDVDAGAPVVIVDAGEHVVAAARLDAGRVVRNSCVFAFTVRTPAASRWYVVQVGNHQSEALTASQLARKPIRFG